MYIYIFPTKRRHWNNLKCWFNHLFCCLLAVHSSEFQFPPGIQGISQPVATLAAHTWSSCQNRPCLSSTRHSFKLQIPLNLFFQASFASLAAPHPLLALCFGTCCLALLNAVCAQLGFPTPRAGHFAPGQLAQCSTGCVLGKAVLSGFVLPGALLSSTVSGWIPHTPLADRWSSGHRKLPTPREGPLHYRAVLMIRKVLLSAWRLLGNFCPGTLVLPFRALEKNKNTNQNKRNALLSLLWGSRLDFQR